MKPIDLTRGWGVLSEPAKYILGAVVAGFMFIAFCLGAARKRPRTGITDSLMDHHHKDAMVVVRESNPLELPSATDESSLVVHLEVEGAGRWEVPLDGSLREHGDLEELRRQIKVATSVLCTKLMLFDADFCEWFEIEDIEFLREWWQAHESQPALLKGTLWNAVTPTASRPRSPVNWTTMNPSKTR